MIDLEQLKKRLEIDKMSLDDEIIGQPALFYEVSEAYVEAIGTRDMLKEQLATSDAQLDGEVRLDLEKAEVKITEGMVKSEIQISKKHEKAFKAYIAAKTIADKLGVLKDSFEQRSHALKHLANLYVSNYYDTTSVQGTSSQDKAVYDGRRRILAQARGHRDER